MSWKLAGTYIENCSCTAICPCTWSGLRFPATTDRCRAVLTWHVQSGEIERMDVSGLVVGMVIDTPPLMSDGNWRAGVLIDDTASTQQVNKLASVFLGQLGGPPAWLAPLIGEMLGRRSDARQPRRGRWGTPRRRCGRHRGARAGRWRGERPRQSGTGSPGVWSERPSSVQQQLHCGRSSGPLANLSLRHRVWGQRDQWVHHALRLERLRASYGHRRSTAPAHASSVNRPARVSLRSP